MTAQPTEKFRLFSAALGIVTMIVGVAAVIYDGKFEGAGIITAGLAITGHALQ